MVESKWFCIVVIIICILLITLVTINLCNKIGNIQGIIISFTSMGFGALILWCINNKN